MEQSYYRVAHAAMNRTCRIVQISDVHFSSLTSTEQNRILSDAIIEQVRALSPHIIALTGDLVSRNPGKTGIADAARLAEALRAICPVLYTLGNHEMDMPAGRRKKLLRLMQEKGVTLLNNRTIRYGGLSFTGVVFPREMYRGEDGSYRNLPACTPQLMEELAGPCNGHPHILLAHSPMGLDAYRTWGADLVLSGHVHGGIVRIPGVGGILSPERRFFPPYSKGLYRKGHTAMVVSAGIGKLRVGNPAEIVVVEIGG
ncbi:MAG: metallophosphoesterase [Oscillospiraceae bacterium]|nr:metallophosphoesterase [Oscillospiraceae bacterium]